MSLLSKEQILNSHDRQSEIVEVPEWGGQVKVCTMSGTARDRFEASIADKSGGVDMQNIRAKLAAATIVDDNGNLMFSDDDVKALGNKSCAALDRVFAASQRVNAITNTDVEKLAKNS